jgi:alginate O-acetyltransferase complex protein AlgI
MFFTSYEFLFLFLPLLLVVQHRLMAGRLSWANKPLLIAASLVFYWTLDAHHLPHLLASVVINYLLAAQIRRRHGSPASKNILVLGILFNLTFLGYLKYRGAWASDAVVIPLGISFYVLQQIGYLINVSNSKDAIESPADYTLFVTFFPYVIAGPIGTRRELMPQITGFASTATRNQLFSAFTLFSIGLFKKVVFADSAGIYVDQVFGAVGDGIDISAADALSAAILYTLQLYFDFSGYSDMAIGLAAMFGIRLAENFNSPFKAVSIMDFWRRWHISATSFFTSHLYLPIVMKVMRSSVKYRFGKHLKNILTIVLPSFLCFFLIGTWHGTGVTSVIFGLIMGAAISINHLWIKYSLPALPKTASRIITLLVVVGAMVFARTDDWSVAMAVFSAMTGPALTGGLLNMGLVTPWVMFLGCIVLFSPNSSEITGFSSRDDPVSGVSLQGITTTGLATLNACGVAFSATAFAIALVFIPRSADFIYYRI